MSDEIKDSDPIMLAWFDTQKKHTDMQPVLDYMDALKKHGFLIVTKKDDNVVNLKEIRK